MEINAQTSSLTQFLGNIVTEANHYRGDFFIFMESVIARLHDYNDTKDQILECIVASRDCGAEWIYPEQCDGKSYSWVSILHHDTLNHIYKCRIYWHITPLIPERTIEYKEISHEDMVAWMYSHKDANDTVNEIVEMLK